MSHQEGGAYTDSCSHHVFLRYISSEQWYESCVFCQLWEGKKQPLSSVDEKANAAVGRCMTVAINHYQKLEFGQAREKADWALKQPGLSAQDRRSILLFALLCEYGVVFLYSRTEQDCVPNFAMYPLPKAPIQESRYYRELMSYAQMGGEEGLGKYIEAIDNTLKQIHKNLENEEKYQCQVFLAYSTDQGLESPAEELYDELMWRNIHPVFYSPKRLRGVAAGGAQWEAEIYTTLYHASMLVLVITDWNSFQSSFARLEVDRYRKRYPDRPFCVWAAKKNCGACPYIGIQLFTSEKSYVDVGGYIQKELENSSKQSVEKKKKRNRDEKRAWPIKRSPSDANKAPKQTKLRLQTLFRKYWGVPFAAVGFLLLLLCTVVQMLYVNAQELSFSNLAFPLLCIAYGFLVYWLGIREIRKGKKVRFNNGFIAMIGVVVAGIVLWGMSSFGMYDYMRAITFDASPKLSYCEFMGSWSDDEQKTIDPFLDAADLT